MHPLSRSVVDEKSYEQHEQHTHTQLFLSIRGQHCWPWQLSFPVDLASSTCAMLWWITNQTGIHIPKSSSVLRSASLCRCWQQTRKFFLRASSGLCGPPLYASAILQEVEHLKPTDGCPFCWAAPATDVLRWKPCPPVEPMGGKLGSILLWGSAKLLNESMDIRKYFEMAPQLSCWWKTIISRVFGHESSIHPHLTSWSMDLQVEHMGIMGLCSAAPVADAETGSYPAVSGLPSGRDLDRCRIFADE